MDITLSRKIKKENHSIYINDKRRHINVPYNFKCIIVQRLIKENNLVLDIKKMTINYLYN